MSFDLISKIKDTLNLARLHKKIIHCSIDIEAPDTLNIQGDQPLDTEL